MCWGIEAPLDVCGVSKPLSPPICGVSKLPFSPGVLDVAAPFSLDVCGGVKGEEIDCDRDAMRYIR